MTSASSAWTTTRTTPWSSPATKPPTKPLIPAKKQIDKLIVASVRAVCEHAFAHLKNWRILTKLRLHVRHATTLLRVLLVLTNIEIAR
ncbi:transposase family protein [Streptomyces sp. NPDC057889]|uniref:transposase family protein n=1 Tax=unclassified Streptomyces TaxID=2593676 RepID=UPI00367BE233